MAQQEQKARKEPHGANFAKDATDLAVATSAALVAGGPHAAAVAAVAGTVTVLLRSSIDVVAKRRAHLAEKFVERLLLSFETNTPDEVRTLLEANIEEPYVAETLFESVRRLVDTPHVCVAEALGGLAAEYVFRKREPDAFFRNSARLLTELSKEEFGSLKDLVALASSATAVDAAANVLELHWMPSRGQPPYSIRLERHDSAKGTIEHADLGTIGDAPRLFHLLKVHGLGRDNPIGFTDTIGGPQVIVIDAHMIVQLRALLRG